jgi:hypothetical protein
MTFQVQNMLGDQALVSGTDHLGNEGRTIVSTTQWDELKARKNFSAASEDFDRAVEAFFKPLVEAAEKADKAMNAKTPDSASFIVLKEAVEGTPSQPGHVVALSQHSIILRLIEEGNTDRLVWVDESTLGVLAQPAAAATTSAPSVEEVQSDS